MDKSNTPAAFGVSKPEGHTLISFACFGDGTDLTRQHKILAVQVAEPVRDTKPMPAQHYGYFITKNLTETPIGQTAGAAS